MDKYQVEVNRYLYATTKAIEEKRRNGSYSRSVRSFGDNVINDYSGTTRSIVKYLDTLAYLFCKDVGNCVAVGITGYTQDKKLYVTANRLNDDHREYITRIYNMLLDSESELYHLLNYISERNMPLIRRKLNTLYKNYIRGREEDDEIKNLMDRELGVGDRKRMKDILLDIAEIDMARGTEEPLRGKLKKLRMYTLGFMKLQKKIEGSYWKDYGLCFIENKTVDVQIREDDDNMATQKLSMHAEMKLLTHMDSDKSLSIIFGISKLACYMCSECLTDRRILYKGTHRKVYDKGWLFPGVELKQTTKEAIRNLARELYDRVVNRDTMSIKSDSSVDTYNISDEEERQKIRKARAFNKE